MGKYLIPLIALVVFWSLTVFACIYQGNTGY